MFTDTVFKSSQNRPGEYHDQEIISSTWVAGEVTKYKGQCSLIKLTDGHVVHFHLDHSKQKVGNTTGNIAYSSLLVTVVLEY